MSENSSLLKPAQLAELLAVSPRTIANWRASRRIPFIAISKRTIRYDLAAVTRALAAKEIRARSSN